MLSFWYSLFLGILSLFSLIPNTSEEEMSLRKTSRELFQVESQVMHGFMDQALKMKSSSKKVTNPINIEKSISYDSKLKVVKAEESLRIVMYLSLWGPN
ncbi:hypothetical protein V6N13_080337 [Hibiscus sabdariffa]|uniref:Uncharacterized protein n=1 Tax=Hibiscus sabdariffa TaxID=183260 RepID=A0ABR2PYA2_9ROSI